MPPLDPLIDGLLDRNTLAFMYGPRGEYKSFVALDWALHLAVGNWWQSHAVGESTVLYVAAEGVYGLWSRARQHQGVLCWFRSRRWPVRRRDRRRVRCAARRVRH
jgi:hypothetical protein